MAYRHLDEYLVRLEQHHELLPIASTVSPDWEVAEIAARTDYALLFENVEGSDFPLVVNLFGTEQRMAWALNAATLDELRQRLSRLLDFSTTRGLGGVMGRAGEFMSILRTLNSPNGHDAPVQEVVNRAPDLTRLPALRVWEAETRRSLPHVQLVTDSGTRMCSPQVIDGQTLSVPWTGDGTQRVAAAVVIGGDPAAMWSGCAPLPLDIDSTLLAGWLRNKALRVAQCVTQPLEVLADAEIVIEGWIDPQARITNPVRGGAHGFYVYDEPLAVMHVTAITHRRKAVCALGLPGEYPVMLRAAERLFLPLLRIGLDEIRDVNLRGDVLIASIAGRYPGHAHKTMCGLWGMEPTMYSRAVIVVDESVDVHDLDAVAAAVLANVVPNRDVMTVTGPVDLHNLTVPTRGIGGKIGIDATGSASVIPPPLPVDAVRTLVGDEWRLWRDRVLLVKTDKPRVFATLRAVCPDHWVVWVDGDLEDEAALLRRALYFTDWARDLVVGVNGVTLDARAKDVGRGIPAELARPNGVQAQVTARWREYGLKKRRQRAVV